MTVINKVGKWYRNLIYTECLLELVHILAAKTVAHNQVQKLVLHWYLLIISMGLCGLFYLANFEHNFLLKKVNNLYSNLPSINFGFLLYLFSIFLDTL
jgi:hypothetical protein